MKKIFEFWKGVSLNRWNSVFLISFQIFWWGFIRQKISCLHFRNRRKSYYITDERLIQNILDQKFACILSINALMRFLNFAAYVSMSRGLSPELVAESCHQIIIIGYLNSPFNSPFHACNSDIIAGHQSSIMKKAKT